MSEKIGFIGLGIMGQGMARNLLNAGFDLRVWNRTASRMDELAAAGAKIATSPADLASSSDIIIICVSDTPDVEEVILGEDGVIQGAKPGALVIDMSTISPKKTKEGAFLGFILAILISFLFFRTMESIVIGAFLGVIGQAGDLFESMLKRDAEIKDSSNLPGLGGVLDMLDSLLFNIPVLYIYLEAFRL